LEVSGKRLIFKYVELQKIKLPILAFVLLSCLWLLGFSLQPKENTPIFDDAQMSIHLRWIKGYETETWEQARIGLLWGLSHLGAMLPENQLNQLTVPIKSNIFAINLNKAGFTEEAKKPLFSILQALKSTEEYAQMGGVDLGRFLILTLHSPLHYYAITGVPSNLETFKNTHGLSEKDDFRVFPVINSSVSKGNRVLFFNCNQLPLKMGFMAQEGTGDVRKGNFQPKHSEVYDIMPNGQLRFAIYAENGELETASPRKFSSAGKPSKCQWCHESQVLRLYKDTPDVPNYLTSVQFLNEVEEFQAKVAAFQQNLPSKIIFSNPSNHTLQELLYLSFMEPTAQRLAIEWNIPEVDVLKRLGKMKTHRQEEFKFLGENVYDRKRVEKKSPYVSVRVADSVRDEVKKEIDLLTKNLKFK
jgi:hypothetical protein